MKPKEKPLTRQAEKALQAAANGVVEEARRTHGSIIVWENGAVSAKYPTINCHRHLLQLPHKKVGVGRAASPTERAADSLSHYFSRATSSESP